MRMMTNRQIKKSEEAEAMNEDDKDDDGNSETPPVKKTERCRSMTNVQSLATGFPTMHYIALAFLALSICLSFLVATDQSLHILESMQVRMLWSILIGSFTFLAVVCFDLSCCFMAMRHSQICPPTFAFLKTSPSSISGHFHLDLASTSTTTIARSKMNSPCGRRSFQPVLYIVLSELCCSACRWPASLCK